MPQAGAPGDGFLGLVPEHVLDAVEDIAGLRATGRALALNSYENRVHDVELEDGSHRVVKFYRPGRWSAEAILDEHRFLLALSEEGQPVAAPEVLGPSALGRTLGQVGGIYYACFPKVRGRLLQADELDLDALQRLGRLLARLHNVGAAEAAPHRPRLLAQTYAEKDIELLCQRFAPPHLAPRYRAAAQAICRAAAPLLDLPVLRIHGDCHLGNILHTAAGPCFVDFDDFLNGPAVQDLWLLAAGERDRLEAIYDGYTELRGLPRADLSLIEPLRGLRMIHYAAWIAHRHHDPAFVRAFPTFTEERFWVQEVDDLERQAQRLPKSNMVGI